MQVREGELVIVTGPSGSGKTTLLTILGTMRRPSEGKLRLLGTDIGGLLAASSTPCATACASCSRSATSCRRSPRCRTSLPACRPRRSPIPTWDEARARHLLGLLGSRGQGRFLARRAVGRPAAACRHRPRHDRAARSDHRRRADLGARSRVGPRRGRPAQGSRRCAPNALWSCRRTTSASSTWPPRRLHIEDGRCFEVPIHYH